MSGDCFDCIIQNVKYDVTTALKKRIDVCKLILSPVNDPILTLFHAPLVVSSLKNNGHIESVNCKPNEDGNMNKEEKKKKLWYC